MNLSGEYAVECSDERPPWNVQSAAPSPEEQRRLDQVNLPKLGSMFLCNDLWHGRPTPQRIARIQSLPGQRNSGDVSSAHLSTLSLRRLSLPPPLCCYIRQRRHYALDGAQVQENSMSAGLFGAARINDVIIVGKE